MKKILSATSEIIHFTLDSKTKLVIDETTGVIVSDSDSVIINDRLGSQVVITDSSGTLAEGKTAIPNPVQTPLAVDEKTVNPPPPISANAQEDTLLTPKNNPDDSEIPNIL